MSPTLGSEPPRTKPEASEAQNASECECAMRWCNRVEGVDSIRTKTILLVEDEVFVREVTSQILEAAGYRVLTARSSAEALPLYQSAAEVDLLLTDVVLPGASGYLLAAMLRRQSPRLKVLYVTGYLEQMGVSYCGGENCLPKPFSTEVLLQSIRQLLREKSPQENLCSGLLAPERRAQDLCRNL